MQPLEFSDVSLGQAVVMNDGRISTDEIGGMGGLILFIAAYFFIAGVFVFLVTGAHMTHEELVYLGWERD
jgi:hypothetical protein